MRELADQGVLHPLLASIADHEHVYGHQETAIRSIVAGPEHTGFDGYRLWQDGVLSLSDYQQGVGTPGSRSGGGHQRGHNLPNERTCRGPAWAFT